MNSTSRAGHWQGVYETRDTTDVSWYQDQATTSLTLVTATAAKLDCAVIDVGGGASTFVDGLLERGFRDVSVLDISGAALEVTKNRLGRRSADVHWLVEDLLSWTPGRSYGVWHDRAVLHFLTDEADRSRYSDLLAAAVRPGGHAVIGTFAPDGPAQCSGLPVQQYDAAGIARLAGPAFTLVESRTEQHVTPSDSVQAFTWATLQRH